MNVWITGTYWSPLLNIPKRGNTLFNVSANLKTCIYTQYLILWEKVKLFMQLVSSGIKCREMLHVTT